MKTTKITITNLFGITELELDGSSIELTGKKGSGKTSVIDAIRYALTNGSNRDYILRQGANEGEIFIQTDTGLQIDRKKRAGQTDYKSITENGKDISKPETFLQTIFTPMQLNPVEFTKMSRQEQNRIILDLIEFEWDLDWIKEKFGELPNVNYKNNILQVLADIQAENGEYFMNRQDINRDIRNKQAFIEDITKDIPAKYDFKKWQTFDLGEKYRVLEKAKDENSKIDRAKAFKDGFENQKRGLEADRDIESNAVDKAISSERESLLTLIERLKAEIVSAEKTLGTLDEKANDKKKVIEAEYNEKFTKLIANVGIADEYIGKERTDIAPLLEEITNAEAMKKHLNEYERMLKLQDEVSKLIDEAKEYTRKIELARELPSEILKTATIPVKGLTVVDGIPLINGLPISNLSEGEQLDLCVDVAVSNPNALKIILIDGAEKLDDKSRAELYDKCKAKGLQFIATRTTNDNELNITQL